MIFASSNKDSDMFYATKVGIHDPFFYLDTGKRQYVFLDHREIEVFREKNKNNLIEAVLLNPFLAQAGSDSGKLARLLLKEYGMLKNKIKVPTNFPLDMADYLRKYEIKIIPQKSLFPERESKNKIEIDFVRENTQRLCRAFDRVEEILKQSNIKKDEIKYKNKTLTSEFLKKEIELTLLENNLFDTEGMIVSCGAQSAIPHHNGSGILRPNQPIICDIFPKSRENNYYSDMTRTYVKGQASEEIKNMYVAVLEAQEKAISSVKPGVTGREIYQICVNIFLKKGFHVGDKGFVHGTGHGLGLEIHEEPYLNKYSQAVLREGQIFSIEPGLYYPEIGGVRIEDLVVVTKNGCENLTKQHKKYLIA